MSLFDYRNLLFPFGGRGFGMPSNVGPVLNGLVQWLNSLKDDGTTLNDKIDPLRADPEPTLVEVNCLEFDGTNDRVDLGMKHNFIQQTGIFSIEFYAKRNTLSGYQRIAYPLANDVNLNLTGWRVQFQTGVNDLNMYIANGGLAVSSYTYDTGVDTTELHHYKLEGDGARITLYVDGVEADSNAMITGNFGGEQVVDTSIGTTEGQSSSFNGKLSHFIISDENGPVGSYPFAEGFGLPQDTSGNGNHATANTATWTTADGIPSANHKAGHSPAVKGDGVGAYIDLGFIPNDNTEVEVVGEDLSGIVAGVNTGSYWLVSAEGDDIQSLLGDSSNPLKSGVSASGIHTIKVSRGILTVDGVTYTGTQETTAGVTATMFMFARRSGASPASFEPGYIHSFIARELDTGNLIRDMTPLPDGKFLDKVHGEVYSNEGTGTLVTRHATALNNTNEDGEIEAMPTKSIATFDGVIAGGASCISESLSLDELDAIKQDFHIRTTITLNESTGLKVVGGLLKDPYGAVSCGVILNGTTLGVAAATGGSAITRMYSSYTMDIGETAEVELLYDGATMELLVNGSHHINDSSTFIGDIHYPYPATQTKVSVGCGRDNLDNSKYNSAISCRSFELVGIVRYDFTDYLGKTEDTITDLSGNGNDGAVTFGTGGPEAFWAKRYEDEAGTVVDSANHLPLTNPGGYVHNGSECGILQTDGLLWNEFWAPSGVYTAKYYADLLAHASGDDNLWLKWQANPCIVKEAYTYDEAYVQTDADYRKNSNYVGNAGCGSIAPLGLIDSDGELIYDSNGELIETL